MLKKVSNYVYDFYAHCVSLCLSFVVSLKHWWAVLQLVVMYKIKNIISRCSGVFSQFGQRITFTTQPKPKLFPQEDLNFIADSKLAVSGYESSHVRRILYAIAIFFFIFLFWARFAMLDEITVGIGSVEPSSEVQVIQSLEGGIVSAIYVHEGELVKKDQVLLQLDTTQSTAQYKQSYTQYLVLLATIARLEAEIKEQDHIVFPPEVDVDADLKEHMNMLFKIYRSDLDKTVGNLKRSYELIQSELRLYRPLLKEKVVSEVDIIRLEKEANNLQGQIIEKMSIYHSDILKQLDQARTDLGAIREILTGLKDKMVRTTIRSPLRGIINNLHITTIGGVIQPGMNILEVVPVEEKLIITAKIKPSDIAFIHAGQKAIVKFTAYDYSIYGGLDAVVSNVSPTTSIDQQGNPFYEIKLTTKQSHLEKGGKNLPIIPGMVASVDVLTGEKSVLHYLLKPILKAQEKALKER